MSALTIWLDREQDNSGMLKKFIPKLANAPMGAREREWLDSSDENILRDTGTTH
jgi:hypothetical protein